MGVMLEFKSPQTWEQPHHTRISVRRYSSCTELWIENLTRSAFDKLSDAIGPLVGLLHHTIGSHFLLKNILCNLQMQKVFPLKFLQNMPLRIARSTTLCERENLMGVLLQQTCLNLGVFSIRNFTSHSFTARDSIHILHQRECDLAFASQCGDKVLLCLPYRETDAV